jgi:hypothetical protein
LLLLGEPVADDPARAVDVLSGELTPQSPLWIFNGNRTLLEPLVRALATDRGRRQLDDIHRLVDKLNGSDESQHLLPDGWQAVWQPVWQAREELRQR